MSEPIVKILPLSALYNAIQMSREFARGMIPTRIVACPVQIAKWMADAEVPLAPAGMLTLNILGIPVIAGPDAAPELIWAIPVTDGQNAGGY